MNCTCLSPLGWLLENRERRFPPPEVNPGCPVHDHGDCICHWEHYQRDGTWATLRIEAAFCQEHPVEPPKFISR